MQVVVDPRGQRVADQVRAASAHTFASGGLEALQGVFHQRRRDLFPQRLQGMAVKQAAPLAWSPKWHLQLGDHPSRLLRLPLPEG